MMRTVYDTCKILLIAAALLQAAAFSLRAQVYRNPVIPGDFPDPSVIRVGKDFYATTTTGGWAPHFPILHSTDLINWKIIGAVFDQKPSWAKGDFWAPEIISDKNQFFVYYTARRDEGKNKKGTLCVAVAVARKPAGPYTDHGALVCQEMGSLDPFFMRDENGKPYLIWKEDGNDRSQPTWLYAQALDESGTKLIGKPQRLFRNTEPWEKNVIEGAYIKRRGEYFYLFYSGSACCGRACDYALGVARSKTLLGKWVKNPANPILKGNSSWQCPGHGSLVETSDGRDFLLYHAYRKRASAFNIGREALLDEVKWRDGWAVINNNRGPSESSAVPFGGVRQQNTPNLSDEFDESRLDAKWEYSIYSRLIARLENGFLSMLPIKDEALRDQSSEVVLAERTISGSYTATVRIDRKRIKPNETAGIAAYSWRGAAVGISLGENEIFVWRREGGKQTEPASTTYDGNEILLRMSVKDGENYRFSYSEDEKNWCELGGEIAASYVESARIALIFDGEKGNSGILFDWLRVAQN